MKGGIGPFTLRGVERAQTKQELISILEKLAFYCQEPDAQAKGAADLAKAMKQFTYWPENDVLQQLDRCVMFLVRSSGPLELLVTWKAFRRVDKRMPSLLLVLRVNNLVKRALARLTESGHSTLAELSWEQGKAARDLLEDIARVRESPSAAKTIDWTRHERVLLRFSRTSSVQLACGKNTASPEVRCYARVLELIVDHDKRESPLRKSKALVGWVVKIRHPMAKDLEGFYHERTFAENNDRRRLVDAIKTRLKREKARERDRRYRAKILCRKSVVS